MNIAAITTIAGLEVRQRIRSSRWKWTLSILFVLISVLVLGSLYLTVGIAEAAYREWARFLYDITLGLVLFLGIAAAPTISATSINGDRRDATLALVQATPITSAELTVGKLLGSWVSSLALIGVAAPYLLWGLFTGPMSVFAGVLGIVVTALILGTYCAIGLGFSALTARPAASAMLTQATVLMLLVGLPIAFGMTLPLTTSDHRVRVAEMSYAHLDENQLPTSDALRCDDRPRTRSFVHSERVWWLLLPNPLMVVSDAIATGVDARIGRPFDGGASMAAYGQSIARSGPYIADSLCSAQRNPNSWQIRQWEQEAHERRFVGHSWYLGLLANLVFGGLGLWVAVRRLRVPARTLPKGVRVA